MICSQRFLYVLFSKVGIAAATHWRKYTAAQAKGDSQIKNDIGTEVLVSLPGPVFLDDELGGCSDDDFAPIPLMDEDRKEALLDNKDGEDEGDNVEEVAEGGWTDNPLKTVENPLLSR